MKKLLLSLTAAFLVSCGLFAQTISMPWNQYAAAPKTGYQGKDDSKVSTYTPVVGDIVTVTVAGTSDKDITGLQVALVDDAPPSYWTELAGFKLLGDVTANTAFTFTFDLAVTKTGTPKIVFDGKNATLAGADGTGTSITLDLTTYTVSIAAAQSGVVTLISNGTAGQYQLAFPDTLKTTPAVKVGDVVKVTLAGTSNVDVTGLQAVIIDETATATPNAYWTQLSNYNTLGDITANTPFTLSTTDTITAASSATGFKSQDVILFGKSTANIGLKLTTFTATIIGNVSGSTTVDNSALVSEVTKAQASYDGSVDADYQTGARAALLAAIATAKAAETATVQADINAAKAALIAAEATFAAAKTTVTVDNSALVSEVTKAQASYDGSVDADYQTGARAALLAAIATAKAAETATVQADIDAAKMALVDALAAFDAAKKIVPVISSLVASCDTGKTTAFNTAWYSYAAGATTITPLTSATSPFKMTKGGANGTDSAAVAFGHLENPDGTIVSTKPGAVKYESAGIGFGFADPIAPFDLSKGTGISFYHKGEAVNFSVMLSTVLADQGFDYSYAVPSHTDWTLVTVPFTSLAQASWMTATQKTPWDASKATKVQWQVKDGTARDYEFGIDEVTVLGVDLFPKVVVKTALDSVITVADVVYANTSVGTQTGNCRQGTKDSLNTVIVAAKAVSASTTSSQIEVTNTTTALSVAIATFKAAVINLGKDSLNAEIATANAFLASITVGTNKGQYPSTSTIIYKITSATTVATNPASTAAQISAAIKTLQAAEVTFKATQIGDNTALAAAITAAKASKTAAVVGTAIGNYPKTAVDALQTAIDAADIVSAGASTQVQLDAAKTALATAVTAFNDAKVLTAIGDISDISFTQIDNSFLFPGASAKLINILGQVVATGVDKLDASQVAAGIYFIVIDGAAKEVFVK